MARALVTGSGGFVGRHLCEHLCALGHEVCGVDRTPSAAADVLSCGSTGDICDTTFVTSVLRQFRPTHVFHFAWTFNSPDHGGLGSTDGDVAGASVLFEAVRRVAGSARVLFASSSAVYGMPERQPIDEDAELKPTTGYGARKVLVEDAAAALNRAYGMGILAARTFNLIGPSVPQRLLPGSLTAQIVAAENGGPQTVRVGRLDSSRDYLDVRDAVRAYSALAFHSKPNGTVFNVCSGVSRSCRELAEELIRAAGVRITLLHDESRMQPGDVSYQRGSATRLERLTGWAPTISFSTSIRDMLAQERGREQ